MLFLQQEGEGLAYERPVQRPAYLDKAWADDPRTVPAPADLGKAILAVVGSPNVASKDWVVRQYEEETNLRATIVLDVSRSMAWSGAQLRALGGLTPPTRLTKLQYAEILTASLSLLLLRQRDAVGLVRFDERVRSAVPARA